MNLKAWAKENQPIFAVLGSILVIGGAVLGGVKLAFSAPDLSISIQVSDLRLPVYLFRGLERSRARDSAVMTDSTNKVLKDIRDFLLYTSNFTQITLSNNSAKSLDNLDLRLQDVRDVDGWAVEGDAFDQEERQRIVDAVRFDAAAGLLTLRGLSRFPPKSNLKLFVWGDVPYSSLFADDQVRVTYDGGTGRLITERTVRGLDAFVFSNAGLLVLIALLVNVGLWNVVLSKKLRNAGSQTDTASPG